VLLKLSSSNTCLSIDHPKLRDNPAPLDEAIDYVCKVDMPDLLHLVWLLSDYLVFPWLLDLSSFSQLSIGSKESLNR